MEFYVGLDVSLKQTSICVVDQTDLVVREGVVDSRSGDNRGLREVKGAGCGIYSARDRTDVHVAMDRAQAALPTGDLYRRAPCQGRAQDADQQKRPQRGIGIALIMQTGWLKEVHVKVIGSHSVRALLASGALLVKIKRDLENHVRGLLKNLGLVIGRAKFNVFAVRAEELIEGRPELKLAAIQTVAGGAQCRRAAGWAEA